jgi:hypothetical protein
LGHTKLRANAPRRWCAWPRLKSSKCWPPPRR